MTARLIASVVGLALFGSSLCACPTPVRQAPTVDAAVDAATPVVDAAVALPSVVDAAAFDPNAPLPKGFASLGHAVEVKIDDRWDGTSHRRSYSIHLKRSGTGFAMDAETIVGTGVRQESKNLPASAVEAFLDAVAAHAKDPTQRPVDPPTYTDHATIDVFVTTLDSPEPIRLRSESASHQWTADGLWLAHDKNATMRNVQPSINSAYAALLAATGQPGFVAAEEKKLEAWANEAPCHPPDWLLMDGTKMHKSYCP
ncbi:hypothetical protein BH09MYX1_BH09MYX1_02650 [soil metagenome]